MIPNLFDAFKRLMNRAVCLLLILCFSVSFAQFGSNMHRPEILGHNPVTFEAIPYWSFDSISIDLVILYRVSPAFFYFTKVEATQQNLYEAKGELNVEILNDKDVTITRDFRPIQIKRNSLPVEGTPLPEEIQGAFSFKLKKGSYRIVLEAKDSESNKSVINRDTKVVVPVFSPSALNISPIIFVEPISSDTSTPEQKKFFPMICSGSVHIGKEGGILFQVISPDTATALQISWKLSGKNDEDEDIQQSFHGNQCVQQTGTLIVFENLNRISYGMKKDSKNSRFVFAPIPLERLETGKYRLSVTVTQDTLRSSNEFPFDVIWPSKPRSFSDFRLAVAALKYVATEDEIDRMTAFSYSKSMKAFKEFWQKQNPDTTRALNPRMVEYYRRVDETIKRFSTANDPDGYRTDRGRIYILFGSPSFTNRLLKPNSVPTEIWTYEKLRKRFTFTDQHKNGNYILVKQEEY